MKALRVVEPTLTALLLAALGGCLTGCNATDAQIKAYGEITAITVKAAHDSGVAVQANVTLHPVGGRIFQGFELYGLDVNASILANPAAVAPAPAPTSIP